MKHNQAPEERHAAQLHGIKRTSSGLTKAFNSHSDHLGYTTPLTTSDYENELPASFHVSKGSQSVPLSSVLFDEDDFDSDIDLDVEDPAMKQVVQYPSLPPADPAAYSPPKTHSLPAKSSEQKHMADSSQPIPWSSSPIEHLKTPPGARREAEPTKRRTLPWLQNSGQAGVASPPESDSNEELPTDRPAKRRSLKAAPTVSATPRPKSSKHDYPWDTTQSAIKQKQKDFREANKKAASAKVVDGTDEVKAAAAAKKRKNTVHRIFLSEEQQNVLNLVVEDKKSVFFTGSAGTLSTFFTSDLNANPDKVPVNRFSSEKSSQRYEGSSFVSPTE